jgi:hypothetical protein
MGKQKTCMQLAPPEQGVYIIRWDFDEDFMFQRVQFPLDWAGVADAAKWLKSI